MSQYQLTLNDEQVQMLLRALDVYSRIGCGQFDRILEMFRDDPRRREKTDWRTLPLGRDTLFRFIKQQLLSLEGDASYSICSSEVPVDYRMAWDMLQVVRHHIAWEAQPEGGHLVQFDPPMNTSALPFCTIETCDETTETDQVDLDVLHELANKTVRFQSGRD